MNMITKQLQTEVKDVDIDGRAMTFVMSSESKDRDGDIIEVGGWELDNFMKNPVFLVFHDQKQFPIGKVEKMWADNGKLLGRVRFADKGTYETADVAYELYKQGIMNAVSVSFAGKQYEPMEDGGYRFTGQELYELSAVPVPANAEAVAVARKALELDGVFTEAQPDSTEQADAIEDAMTDLVKAVAKMTSLLS